MREIMLLTAALVLGIHLMVISSANNKCELELNNLKRTQQQLEEFKRDLSSLEDRVLDKFVLLNSTTEEKDF
jgi:di/tricarboxylate transporter